MNTSNPGSRHTLSVLVENKPGVLARIAGLFSRRGFNIDTLAVGPTEDPNISRVTMTVDGALHPIDQVTVGRTRLGQRPLQRPGRDGELARNLRDAPGPSQVGEQHLGRGGHHPTRGVDIGAQAAIWSEIRHARDAGLAVLLVSADLEELIDQLEPTKRGIYGGACDYLSYAGDMDVAIAIRTAVVKDQQLYVQAAAGVVADSVPELEWKETEHKARAILRASELVEEGLE